MPHAPDLSGRALDDRYELHALIGEGAFGRVYEGRDRRLERPVAVKVIKPWWAEDPEWVATFEREARLLARVSDPGIVQIFDVGQGPEGIYYVSELVDGENLATRLSRGPVPAWEACGVAAQLCRALATAHRQQIVHRDVKPANILLSCEGRVKIGDFGVARLAEGSTDGGASIVGTPRYMAPEQGRGWPTTPATDVYSVGVVLYEMLAGRSPFTGDSAVELALRHLEDPPPPLPAGVPHALVEITGRALAKEPGDRYADGAEMAEALMAARRGSAAGRRARLAPARPRYAVQTPARTSVQTSVPRSVETSVQTSVQRSVETSVETSVQTSVRRSVETPAQTPARALVGAGAVAPVPSGAAALTAAPALQPLRRPAPVASLKPLPVSHPAATGPEDRSDATRHAPVMSPRRNVNPSARRRAAAALGTVILLLVGMAVAAIVLAAPARTTVPHLTGLRRAAAASRARHARLAVAFSGRYSTTAPVGVAIAQHPRAGGRVAPGARVHVVLSRGPRPISLPSLAGQSAADAQRTLTGLGLHPRVRDVAAPGVTPGTVTAQAPSGHTVPAGSTVTLSVAEVPRWRSLASFDGSSSGVFRIIGQRWRISYSMGFQGTCTWIFVCDGPTAHVINAATGQTVSAMSLNDGSGQTQTFATGPGSYEIRITPGGDTAKWSVDVEDWF